MAHILWLVSLLYIPLSSSIMSEREELLQQDPRHWPGHLEPFGSKQPTAEVEVVDGWPEPKTFFSEYVDKLKPVIFKGVATESPIYTKFTDDFIMAAPNSDKTIVYVEPVLKENRQNRGMRISIKEFIERYHNETMYMINSLPDQFTPHVRMPAPIRCESTRKLIKSHVAWISGGGTKSVLHYDDVDNIHCMFRGRKQLWMIENPKNKYNVQIDRVKGGESGLNVEKVDYTKYPDLRKVDVYHNATVDEGDCIYLPYLWFHQVNSFANDDRMNFAMNVWFQNEKGHVPEGCDIPESEATLDKYTFPEYEPGIGGRASDIERLCAHVPKNGYITLEQFISRLKTEELFNPTLYQLENTPKAFKLICEKMFQQLDVNKDGKLCKKDFKQINELYIDEVDWNKFDNEFSVYIELMKQYFKYLVNKLKKEISPGDQGKVEL